LRSNFPRPASNDEPARSRNRARGKDRKLRPDGGRAATSSTAAAASLASPILPVSPPFTSLRKMYPAFFSFVAIARDLPDAPGGGARVGRPRFPRPRRLITEHRRRGLRTIPLESSEGTSFFSRPALPPPPSEPSSSSCSARPRHGRARSTATEGRRHPPAAEPGWPIEAIGTEPVRAAATSRSAAGGPRLVIEHLYCAWPGRTSGQSACRMGPGLAQRRPSRRRECVARAAVPPARWPEPSNPNKQPTEVVRGSAARPRVTTAQPWVPRHWVRRPGVAKPRGPGIPVRGGCWTFYSPATAVNAPPGGKSKRHALVGSQRGG